MSTIIKSKFEKKIMMLNSKKRCCRRKQTALYYLHKSQKHAKLNTGDTEICEKI